METGLYLSITLIREAAVAACFALNIIIIVATTIHSINIMSKFQVYRLREAVSVKIDEGISH